LLLRSIKQGSNHFIAVELECILILCESQVTSLSLTRDLFNPVCPIEDNLPSSATSPARDSSPVCRRETEKPARSGPTQVGFIEIKDNMQRMILMEIVAFNKARSSNLADEKELMQSRSLPAKEKNNSAPLEIEGLHWK